MDKSRETARHPTSNLLGASRAELEQYFTQLGEKPFRARQLLQWIHQRGVVDFAEMTDLGKPLRARLAECATLALPQVETEQVSRDGTIKWSVRVDSGNCVEMVFIPDGQRGTLCISSQVGCALLNQVSRSLMLLSPNDYRVRS